MAKLELYYNNGTVVYAQFFSVNQSQFEECLAHIEEWMEQNEIVAFMEDPIANGFPMGFQCSGPKERKYTFESEADAFSFVLKWQAHTL